MIISPTIGPLEVGTDITALEPLDGFDRQQSNPQAIPGRHFASNPPPFSTSPPPFGVTPPFAAEGNYSLGSQNSGSALLSYAKRGSGVYGVSPGDGRLSPTPGGTSAPRFHASGSYEPSSRRNSASSINSTSYNTPHTPLFTHGGTPVRVGMSHPCNTLRHTCNTPVTPL
jgi:hypothetical protein